MVSVGRYAAFALVTALLGCSGRSEWLEGEQGAAGETSGGTGAGGTTGTSGTGGVESGGTAGVIGRPTGGAGGTASCLDCPAAEYGLVVEGDGEPYDMTFNGTLEPNPGSAQEPAPSPPCGEQPLRGAAGGCSPSIRLSACEDPMNGPPCLEIVGSAVRYVDRQRGELWDGRIVSDVPAPGQTPGLSSGTLEIELFQNGGELMLRLTVRYTFCTAAIVLDIVC
jgi:hypothetical protein